MTTQSSILAWRIPGQRSLVDYSPWHRRGSDTTEGLSLSINRHEVEYTCAYDSHFLIISDVEYLFVFLLIISVSALETWLLSHLHIFKSIFCCWDVVWNIMLLNTNSKFSVIFSQSFPDIILLSFHISWESLCFYNLSFLFFFKTKYMFSL